MSCTKGERFDIYTLVGMLCNNLTAVKGVTLKSKQQHGQHEPTHLLVLHKRVG
jgi:hypothetical protein